ncbi:MAG: hypothetical protein ACKVQK_23970 [Burkholderiales bacterium]
MESQELRQPLRGTTDAALKIAAGMAVAAKIHQGRRSVIEYLLSPVTRVALEAGRER